MKTTFAIEPDILQNNHTRRYMCIVLVVPIHFLGPPYLQRDTERWPSRGRKSRKFLAIGKFFHSQHLTRNFMQINQTPLFTTHPVLNSRQTLTGTRRNPQNELLPQPQQPFPPWYVPKVQKRYTTDPYAQMILTFLQMYTSLPMKHNSTLNPCLPLCTHTYIYIILSFSFLSFFLSFFLS